jgi:hypothetical protein
LISENISAGNAEFFFKKDEKFTQEISNFKLINYIKDVEIPENGACILKYKPYAEVLIFKKITHKLKHLIIILKEGELSILRKIDS